jgi:DNA-binding NarL/FixJ family response regulator
MSSPLHAVRLVVADDHRAFRQTVCALLVDTGEVEVVGEARDGIEAVGVCEATLPQVALVDIDMPGLDGIAATRRIAERLPSVRVVICSGDLGRGRAEAALAAGAVGVVSKDATLAELLTAVRTAARGGEP